METARRRGMGSVIGVTVAVMAVSWIVLLGVDRMQAGSRVSLERASGSLVASSLTLDALEEVCSSETRRQQLVKLIASHLAAIPLGKATVPEDERLALYLELLDPRPDNLLLQEALADRGLPATLAPGVVYDRRPASVLLFGTGTPASIDASDALRVHQRDLDRRRLRLSPVRVRPLEYTYAGPAGSASGIFGKGRGVMRLSVTASVRLGRDVSTRRRTEDRRFHLKPVYTGTRVTGWDMLVETDPIEREVTDDSSLL